MPRLSVDIDLTYLPADDKRDAALANISAALGRIAIAIKNRVSPTRVQETRAKSHYRILLYPNLGDAADFNFVSVLFRLGEVVRGL
jgi:Nucleotidyl transferase AbiEii toxin, Type IV TA system